VKVLPDNQLAGEMTELRPGRDAPPSDAPAEPLTGQFTSRRADPTEGIPRFFKQVEPIRPFIGLARKVSTTVEVQFSMEFAGLRLTFAVDHLWADNSWRMRDPLVREQWQGHAAAEVVCRKLIIHVLGEIRHRYENAADG
jgi:hypothetical protein